MKRGKVISLDLGSELLFPEVSNFCFDKLLEIILFRRIIEQLERVGEGILVTNRFNVAKPSLGRSRGKEFLVGNGVQNIVR